MSWYFPPLEKNHPVTVWKRYKSKTRKNKKWSKPKFFANLSTPFISFIDVFSFFMIHKLWNLIYFYEKYLQLILNTSYNKRISLIAIESGTKVRLQKSISFDLLVILSGKFCTSHLTAWLCHLYHNFPWIWNLEFCRFHKSYEFLEWKYNKSLHAVQKEEGYSNQLTLNLIRFNPWSSWFIVSEVFLFIPSSFLYLFFFK